MQDQQSFEMKEFKDSVYEGELCNDLQHGQGS